MNTLKNIWSYCTIKKVKVVCAYCGIVYKIPKEDVDDVDNKCHAYHCSQQCSLNQIRDLDRRDTLNNLRDQHNKIQTQFADNKRRSQLLQDKTDSEEYRKERLTESLEDTSDIINRIDILLDKKKSNVINNNDWKKGRPHSV